MPFIVLFIGIVLLVTAVRGTSLALGTLLVNDLVEDNATGKPGFLMWAFCILIVGSLGYVPSMKKFSDTFIVLCLLSLIIANGGFFPNLIGALENVSATASNAGVDAKQLGQQAQTSAGGSDLAGAISGVQTVTGLASALDPFA